MPVILRSFFAELFHGIGQSATDSGFSSSSETDHHDSVTHHDCFHKLDDLCEELFWLLVVDAVQLILDGSLQ